MTLFLDSFEAPDGGPVSMPYFNGYLWALAQRMYSRGWTVIGSRFKIPNLHPWKANSRSALYFWAKEDLNMMRANSLNLRLADTSTIALDCDFNDPKLMEEFVGEVQAFMSVPKQSLFTCSGKKGGKLFFRFMGSNLEAKPPRQLGPEVYTPGHAGEKNYKQELEIKSDLSTFAGLYGLNEEKRLIIYGPYADFPFIGDAWPEALVPITLQEIDAIEQIYRRLVSKGSYVSALGVKQLDTDSRELNRAGVAYYYLSLWKRLIEKSTGCGVVNEKELSDFVHNNPLFTSHYRPLFKALGLDGCIALCDYIFNGGSGYMSFEQLVDVDNVLPILSIATVSEQQALIRQAGFFLRETRHAADRFYALAISRGLDVQGAPEDVLWALNNVLTEEKEAQLFTEEQERELELRGEIESLNDFVPMPFGGAQGQKLNLF